MPEPADSQVGFPTWAKLVIAIGVVPCLALYFAWFLSSTVSTQLSQMQENDRAKIAVWLAHLDNDKILAQTLEQLQRQIFCLGAASTPAERMSCVRTPVTVPR